MGQHGLLTDNQLLHLKGRLTEVLTASCWACGKHDWLIFPTLLGEEFYDAEGSFLTSASMGPKVRLTCRNCGNIIYFSSEALGLEPDDENTDV